MIDTAVENESASASQMSEENMTKERKRELKGKGSGPKTFDKSHVGLMHMTYEMIGSAISYSGSILAWSFP